MVKIIFKAILYLILLFGGIYLSENIIPQFDGRKIPPSYNSISLLKKTIDKSYAHNVKEYFPREMEEVEFKTEIALNSINREMSQPLVIRDFTYAETKFSDAQESALKLLVKTANKEFADKEEVSNSLVSLEKILSDTKILFEHTSNNIILRKRFAEGEIAYKNAKELNANRRYASALREARKGIFQMKNAYATSREVLSRYKDPSLLNKWAQWRRRAIQESVGGGCGIVVIKENHILELYKNGKLLKTYTVELGANSINQKMYAGDRATPEGYYRISSKKGYGKSKYGLALLINYPNEEDRQRFLTLKSRKELGERSKIGGLIEIHGGGGRGFDWTDGCVALTDLEMEYVFKMVQVGAPVAIIGSMGSGPINSALKGIK
jgi:lipoprotein-anchoring transpeptidase ErfK/SrfK